VAVELVETAYREVAAIGLSIRALDKLDPYSRRTEY